MDEFEALLSQHLKTAQRYVHYRCKNPLDGEDIVQEVCLCAHQHFHQLKNKAAFKAWLLTIARHKCDDYFRRSAPAALPLDAIPEPYDLRFGIPEPSSVSDALDSLPEEENRLLQLFYFQGLRQQQIAEKLHIPLGTVKSRLHTARQHFKAHFPTLGKEETIMKKLPALLPHYTITESKEAPFSVKWEEIMGWFLVPKLGEKLSWGMYDLPSRKCDHIYGMQVTGKAKVHGIEGVELTAREASYSDKKDVVHRTFVAQLTDTHCRYLATLRNDGDVRNYITFLDEEAFMPNWGFGENNCGNEVNLSVKGHIRREGNIITSIPNPFLLDIVGRYTVEINGKVYDTVCVMDINTYDAGVVSEQFLDQNGRTILWRRYNRNDWAIDRYGKPWTELLPHNARLTVNGETYVEWYDCITDYIL
ncbi:MAG: RNA polymerase sigma factor [Clostridia bacterium]|nr:RNA polymerase sigma factor [Clostridia bacterium]